MPSPAKPSKINQNKPPEFKETMAASMPHVPTMRTLSDSHLRYGLYAVWAAATVAIGVAVGLLVATTSTSTTTSVSPTPVATASLAVVSPDTANISVQQTSPVLQNLVVAPSYDIAQAQAGTTHITATTGQVQPSAGSSSLQPGYAAHNSLQGTVGTAPVQ